MASGLQEYHQPDIDLLCAPVTVSDTQAEPKIDYAKAMKMLEHSYDIKNLIECIWEIYGQKHYQYPQPREIEYRTYPNTSQHIGDTSPIERYTIKANVRDIKTGRINAEAYDGPVCSDSMTPMEELVVHPTPLKRYVVKAKIKRITTGKLRIPEPDELA